MFSRTGWVLITEEYIQGLFVLNFFSVLGFCDFQRCLYPLRETEIVFQKKISYSTSASLKVIDRK